MRLYAQPATAPDRWAAFWGLSRTLADDGEIRRTIVDRRGEIVGALAGHLLSDGSFRAYGLRATDGAAALALARDLAARARRVELTLWDVDLDETLVAALASCGFRAGAAVLRVTRPLTDLPVADPGLTLHYRHEVGPVAFRAAVADALCGSRHRLAPRDADTLIARSTRHGVTARWAVVHAGPAAVGVILPVMRAGRGSLGFMGVAVAHRGRGLGRGVLALGLAELAAAGATYYADGTDVDNQPMCRAFASAGCRFQGIEHTLVKEDSRG